MLPGKNASKKNHYHVIVLERPSKLRFCGKWGFYFIGITDHFTALPTDVKSIKRLDCLMSSRTHYPI